MAAQQPDILVNFINEGQNPLVVKDVFAKMQSLMTTDEHVVNIFIQHKLIGLNASIIVTNWRIFYHYPQIVGGAKIAGHLWRLLGHPQLEEGPIYSRFTIETRFEPIVKMVIGFLPKLQALRLYSLAKEQADWWDEEHRLRTLELQRAASGGLVLKGGLAGIAEQPHPVVPLPHTPFPFHAPAAPHWNVSAPLTPGGPAMQPQGPPEERGEPQPIQPVSTPPAHASLPTHVPAPSAIHAPTPPSHPPLQQVAAPAPTPQEDPVERLRKVKEMFDDGLITKEEYLQRRQAILDSI
ncbi:MAG: SHOCT domain-containing protein [bacterium]